ncbi:MAG: response regulator [Armatimonadetes bacterium]|nr:response regulator [Armatimonadota bacterium]
MADILILEDDDSLRRSLLDTLEDFDYRCEGAASAEEALTRARSTSYDVVIADVRMAGMDGIECLARLRSIRPRAHFIVITGYASENAPVRAIRVEVDDYLHKPFRSEELITSLRRVLEAERRKAGYQQMLEATVPGYRQAAGGAALEPLERQRDRAFQAFFVGVRAGMLDEAGAHALWIRLEAVEGQRERLEETSPAAHEVHGVTEGYAHLVHLLGAAARGETLASRPEPRPGEVSGAKFERLFDRIRKGAVSAEQLKFAHFLRRLESEVRDGCPDLLELYREIWSPG